MDLRRFLEIILRRWPVVLIAFVATTALTVTWVESKPTLYESSATYVVRPRMTDTGEIDSRFLDALLRGPEVNSTIASIARSDAVETRAKERMGPFPPGSRPSVDADVITGTNTISISVKSRDPQAAFRLAEAVGTETIEFIREQRDPYDLALLDPPEIPSEPLDNKKELTIALGVVLGGGLGVALAGFVDSLISTLKTVRAGRGEIVTVGATGGDGDEGPDVPAPAHTGGEAGDTAGEPRPAQLDHVLTVVDGIEPDPGAWRGASGESEFTRALERAARRGKAHTVGVLRITRTVGVDPHASNGAAEPLANGAAPEPVHGRDAERVARLLEAWEKRTGGSFAQLDERTFAVLLHDTSAAAASKLLADWAEILAVLEAEPEAETSALQISIGVREYPRRTAWSAVTLPRLSSE